MTDLTKVEYRVRPITRYVVTRYFEDESRSGSDPKGEFDNSLIAYEVAYALCKDEHQRLGWPPGDERIQYPDPAVQYPPKTEQECFGDQTHGVTI